jgi:hypothetical protein
VPSARRLSQTPVRLASGSKVAVEGKGISPVEVKIEAFDERVKPRAYTS